ncbi:MAG: glycine zipper domain-containing protein [Verrucomicrobiota bacterium]|nr:glycine zipper domain-containing protein [Verrucomicrobiota bacterium]
MINKKSLAVVALALSSAFALNSCETATGTGALIGAGTGALIGGNTGGYRHSGDRALAGAAIGAGAGALIGAAIDADQRGYYEGHEASYYPYGRHTGQPGLLRSPYAPHALVDVRGIPHGALVRDPATGRPFRKP